MAAAALAVVYLAVIVLGDPRAGLISDSGGKLATAQVMAEARTLSPDVGYWAEDLDPEGWFHPLANTERVGYRWVQATSLPYAAATAGLWALAGPLGVALLSVAGGVAAALAARHLARHLGARGDVAFWLVGLASPLAVYAVDAWEHAPAVGLALWGIALALDADRPTRAAAAGALLGAARAPPGRGGRLGHQLRRRRPLRRRVPAPLHAPPTAGRRRCGLRRKPSSRSTPCSNVGSWTRACGTPGRPPARWTPGPRSGAGLTDAVVTGAGLLADETASGIAVASSWPAALRCSPSASWGA